MTLLLLGAGAAASAAGTRLAALLFVGAAIAGGLGEVMPAAAVWTGVMAVGLLRPGASPRRLALPALGSAAVLAAAAASNSAAVVGLWVLGTAAAYFSRGSAPQARRWVLLLCCADVPFVAAVVREAGSGGFEGWPGGLDRYGTIALFVAAGARAALASGAGDESTEAGLLVVRTQTVVLILLAYTSAGRGISETVVAIAAMGFLAGGLAVSEATTDVVQELSLVALAAGAAALGWAPGGWEWGALAAGTLIHYLRVSQGPAALGVFVRGVLRGGGLGLPFLPVVLAQLEGAIRARAWPAAIIAVGLLGGLAARVRPVEPPARRAKTTRRPQGGFVTGVWAAMWTLLAVAAGLWAVLLSLPEGLAGRAVSWPPAWAGGAVVAFGVIGSQLPRAVPASPSRVPVRRVRAPRRLTSVVDRVAAGRTLEIVLVTLILAGAALWAVGLFRGFL